MSAVKDSASQLGRLNPRVLIAFFLCLTGVGLAMFSLAANPPSDMASSNANPSGDSFLVGEPAGPLSGGAAVSTAMRTPTTAGWSVVTSPNNLTTSENDNVYTVTCASALECWAVGDEYVNGSGASQTLIEKWNGTAWSIVTSPNHGASDNSLNGVTCASTSECWAVGDYVNGSGVDQTLIEKYTTN
jgi:hypothetical protein